MFARKLIATLVIVGSALALPGVSIAAQTPPPTQDSVVLAGGPAIASDNDFIIFDINARSGPSGEDPAGTVRFDVLGGAFHLGGPVTCLAVSGNDAIINYRDELFFAGLIVTVQVADDQPDTFFGLPAGRAPTDCSPLFSSGGLPVSGGDIVVTDALPPPTSKDQCKHSGWRQFGFANQGQCVRSVT